MARGRRPRVIMGDIWVMGFTRPLWIWLMGFTRPLWILLSHYEIY